MPKLWHNTIEAHRNAVADTIMDKTAALAAAHGLHALTMAQIAQESGIGRATLYKYFKDVESILMTWHQRQILMHLEELEVVRTRHARPLAALEAVLLAYAGHTGHSHDASLARLLHSMPHMAEAHRHLQTFVADLIQEAVDKKELPATPSPAERARFALGAMQAAPRNRAELGRFVSMVLKGLAA
jgi:AcrR family transcriptional regulator